MTEAEHSSVVKADGSDEALGRADRRRLRNEARAEAREARWAADRFAVPHRTDGPKVTLGVVWFVGLLGAVTISPYLVTLFVVPAAAIAAFQIGNAWHDRIRVDSQLMAGAATVVALSAAAGDAVVFGALIVVAAIGAGVIAAVVPIQGPGARSGRERPVEPVVASEVMIRCVVPVSVAAGSLSLLAHDRPQAFVALIVLVSSYEVGDHLIGTGSTSRIEGPAAGLVALFLVGVGVWLIPPAPLTSTVVPVLVSLTAIACPLGQIFGSVLLPHGSKWAPGMRRLDSYLLAAPLWALLI